MTAPQDVRIPAGSEQIAAYLYRPDGGDSRPCIVMAHGLAGTREDALSGYAEAFCAAGYVVVLFDYRHFGASTGTPRQLIDIRRQQQDYRTVVGWARTLDDVDPQRIVLWGSSYSGGHVLAVAAGDPRIAAVISQAPFTYAIASLLVIPKKIIPSVLLAAIRDQLHAWTGRPPVMLPAVGAPGQVAAMTSPDALPGLEAMVGPKSLWRNELAARLMLRFPFYRPGAKLARLAMPVLVCVCDDDLVTPPRPTVKAAQRAPHAQLRHYPYGHFAIYHDPQVKVDQLDFLRRCFADVPA